MMSIESTVRSTGAHSDTLNRHLWVSISPASDPLVVHEFSK